MEQARLRCRNEVNFLFVVFVQKSNYMDICCRSLLCVIVSFQGFACESGDASGMSDGGEYHSDQGFDSERLDSSVSDGANSDCSSESCEDVCIDSYADCNGFSFDGCEVNLNTHSQHCGRCDQACLAVKNATTFCRQGSCDFECNPGFKDCNGDSIDGCEIDIRSDSAHCGGCNKVCEAVEGRDAICSIGSCENVCSAPFADCNSDESDGCETNIHDHLEHCGGCGVECLHRENAMQTCSSGSCGYACHASFGDCDGEAGNGCEKNLNADHNHCGACDRRCPRNHATPACRAGSCSFACHTGYADCDGRAENACEVNLNTNANHCGGCSRACETRPNSSVRCSAGQCEYTCASGSDADCLCGRQTDIDFLECRALLALHDSTLGFSWRNNAGWPNSLSPTETPCLWYGVGCRNGHVNRVSLSRNNLVGNLPPALEDLVQLYFLDLGRNQLVGVIPPELGNLYSLSFVSLYGNSLEDEIPLELMELPNLSHLDLSANQLSGAIPSDPSTPSSLEYLDLSYNQLTGSIPDFSSFTLRTLKLSRNQLTGPVPDSLRNSFSLEHLELDSNQLTGSIPDIWDSFSQFITLTLTNNRLSGQVPDSLMNVDPLPYTALIMLRGNGCFRTPNLTLASFLTSHDPLWNDGCP